MPRRSYFSLSKSVKIAGMRYTFRNTWTPGGSRARRSSAQSGQPGQPHVQVHLTGRDLLEMQRQEEIAEQQRQAAVAQHVADVAALREQERQAHTAKMRQLSQTAVRLHTVPWIALASLAAYTVMMALFLALELPLIFAGFAALAILDWHNLITLHGLIPWRSWWAYHRGWLIVGVIFVGGFIVFFPFVYLVQCLQLSEQVREIERGKIQRHIAALEAEVITAPHAQQHAEKQEEQDER